MLSRIAAQTQSAIGFAKGKAQGSGSGTIGFVRARGLGAAASLAAFEEPAFSKNRHVTAMQAGVAPRRYS